MAYEKLNLADGDVLKAEHLAHMENGIEGASVQSDWNQTDETAPDFIRNKAFGDEKTVILPLGELEIPYDDENGSSAFVPCEHAIDAGVEMVISWDGKEYVSTVTSFYENIVFGNMAVFGGADTGEPFLGIKLPDAIVLSDVAATSNVTRIVSITAISKKKLNSAYVDAGYTLYITTDNTGIKRLTKVADDLSTVVESNEIATIMGSNTPIILKESAGLLRMPLRVENMISQNDIFTEIAYANVNYTSNSVNVLYAYSAEYTGS